MVAKRACRATSNGRGQWSQGTVTFRVDAVIRYHAQSEVVLYMADDLPKTFVYSSRVEGLANPIIRTLGVFVDFVVCEAVSVHV
jgi:hypothetical protein